MTNKDIAVDLAIIGATPSGIASAITAGRKGLTVVLISSNDQIGGILTNGLGVMDRLYTGFRSPVFNEISKNIIEYYINKYGENSEQVKVCKDTRLTFEPHVAEYVFNNLIEKNKNIKVFKSFIPNKIEVKKNEIKSITLNSILNDKEIKIIAKSYIDASYEGDLIALSGTPYTVGRESREEFNEPHAGRIFSTHGFGAFPLEAAEGDLNLDTFPVTSQLIFSGSTGEGDKAIQSFTYRVCLTSDPDQMIPIKKPKNYKRENYLGILESEKQSRKKSYKLKSQLVVNNIKNYKIRGPRIPNNKISWNDANLPEINHLYPEGDYETRIKISDLHREHALGLLYFFQNDKELPKEIRDASKKWGLPKDEFIDNKNFPKEMYVRETRRIRGRYIFSESDASLSSDFERTPIQKDSVAIADWPMDSHECNANRQPGSLADGKILLSEKTRPSQIPYRTLLPKGIDNLISTFCVSATHVAFGTIRVEPTLIQLGEVAGFAVVEAYKKNIHVADLDVDILQINLVENNFEISFFNDIEVDNLKEQSKSINFLGSKGFFTNYNSRMKDQISKTNAEDWAKGFVEFLRKDFNANKLAKKIYNLNKEQNISITGSQFTEIIKSELSKNNIYLNNQKLKNNNHEKITIGEAAEIIYSLYKDNINLVSRL
ncbi:MAG: FAD-dependent oxidoreductase [Chloroflexota bacterium]|nr:FAD-dependent oxidoreductase [Chloroflexota bacterium]